MSADRLELGEGVVGLRREVGGDPVQLADAVREGDVPQAQAAAASALWCSIWNSMRVPAQPGELKAQPGQLDEVVVEQVEAPLDRMNPVERLRFARDRGGCERISIEVLSNTALTALSARK